MSPRERFRRVVKLYSDMYEVDFPLWIVGVLSKAFHTGVLDPTAFGGPTSRVAQGSLIDAVAAATVGTPLEPLLTAAYVPNLRNAVNHNDYELLFGGSNGEELAGVRSMTGEEWDAPTVRNAWQATADLMNAAMTCCASVGEVVVPSEQKKFADCGVIAITYAVIDSVPYAVVAQLWCFRDVDPNGSWLDSSELIIEPESPTSERAGFTKRAWMCGVPLTGAAVGEAVRDRGWIRVIRVPVAPHMAMGLPKYEHPEGGTYEVVGVADEHDVPFRSASSLPRRPTLEDASAGRESLDGVRSGVGVTG